MSKQENIPLFPLGLVLYPEERLPLHIFEQRYKEMIQVCLKEEIPFGVVLMEEEKMADVGCTARISKVLKTYEDGRMDIMVDGVNRFRVEKIHGTQSFLTATVASIKEPDDDAYTALKERVITQHMRLLELVGRSYKPTMYQNMNYVSYFIAHNAGLTITQKQDVLELISEGERIAYLVNHMETFIPRVEEMEDLKRKVKSNGHFKDFPK